MSTYTENRGRDSLMMRFVSIFNGYLPMPTPADKSSQAFLALNGITLPGLNYRGVAGRRDDITQHVYDSFKQSVRSNFEIYRAEDVADQYGHKSQSGHFEYKTKSSMVEQIREYALCERESVYRAIHRVINAGQEVVNEDNLKYFNTFTGVIINGEYIKFSDDEHNTPEKALKHADEIFFNLDI